MSVLYKIDWTKYLSVGRYRKSGERPDGGEWDKRTPFESDYGRVLFSSAIRRMHDKTQVIPLTNGDSVLTRLTHSIHVMNLAESLIINYCRDNDFKKKYGDEWVELMANLVAVSKAAAFVHDVGNPPFGHFGETVIQDYFERNRKILKEQFTLEGRKNLNTKILDFTQFDGNAQGFRVLTHLQYIGSLDGLNLTYATLGAYMKYPNISDGDKSYKPYIGNKKHGVFYTERDVFEKTILACNLTANNKIKRHPLSFIVEAADSIAYRVMDIEDGFNLGWYSFDEMIELINGFLKKRRVKKSIFEIIGFKSNAIDLKLKCQDGADKKAMVDFRVALIQYLVNLANKNFKKHLKEIDFGEYSNELIQDDVNCVEKALGDFTKQLIFSQRTVSLMEMTGKSVIEGLLNILGSYAFSDDESYHNRFKSIISPSRIAIAYHEKMYNDGECTDPTKFLLHSSKKLREFKIGDLSAYEKWRLIVDFISGMTDKFAVDLYQQLSGQRI